MLILIVDTDDIVLAATEYPNTLGPDGVLRASVSVTIETPGAPAYLLIVEGNQILAEARFGTDIRIDKTWQEAGNTLQLTLEPRHSRKSLLTSSYI